MSRIKSFEEACDKLGLDAATINSSYPIDVLPFKQLTVIVEALNEGWKPNWADKNERKYEVWFWNETGGEFSFDRVVFIYSDSSVGSRLCFRDRETAEYAGRTFEALYDEFFSTI